MIINGFFTFQRLSMIEFSVPIFGIVFIKPSKNAPLFVVFII